ncbi:hypothetical protein RKE25_22780 (plasmid) [Dyella sp. BiH032]|uniref:hypothetical protein n=1 Tax=Dyella sp. BiH032 TaxID=3075430 RepID=UPI0028932E41|nr:hypothetical protein [Dyella sp. BiH032]WNL48361.1 hypothetical protein RKE25_22780 [Dyella sp. BiH032]
MARNAYRYRYQIAAAAVAVAGVAVYQQWGESPRVTRPESDWAPPSPPNFAVKVAPPSQDRSHGADLARLQPSALVMTCVPVAVTSGSFKIYTHQRGVAPLKLTTPAGGDNYLVKLVKAGTKNVVMSAYVSAGDTQTFKVPLGSYEIYYAQGKVWCGEKESFGRGSTRLVRLAGNFEFTKQGNSFVGHEIELIEQIAGNLRSEEVSDDEFASLVPAGPADGQDVSGGK